MTITTPPFLSVNLRLTFKCEVGCKHCNYNCTKQGEDAAHDHLVEVAEKLSKMERLNQVTLTGGDFFHNFSQVVEAARLLRNKGFKGEIGLETSGSFAVNTRHARVIMSQFASVIQKLRIATTPYHNEAVPFNNVKILEKEAKLVFGKRGSVQLHPMSMIQFLEQLDPNTTHTLDEFIEKFGADTLFNIFPLITAGRARTLLRRYRVGKPADSFKNVKCYSWLMESTCVGVNPDGSVTPNPCFGINVGWPGFKKKEDHQLLYALAEGGPYKAFEYARDTLGFTEDPEGYVDHCDLCFCVRKWLKDKEPTDELKPDWYYQ